MYTVQLAKSSHIPFTGGEPTDLVILKDLQQKGYTAEDMAAFYITRQLCELWRNQDPILQVSGDLKEAVRKLATYVSHFIPDFTYEQWQAWIIRHYDKALPFKKFISGELVVPYANGKILEKLSHETGLVCDREILSRIFEANDKGFERILVVYGGSHYYTQHKVLESHFSMPTYSCPPYQWPSLLNCCILI